MNGDGTGIVRRPVVPEERAQRASRRAPSPRSRPRCCKKLLLAFAAPKHQAASNDDNADTVAADKRATSSQAHGSSVLRADRVLLRRRMHPAPEGSSATAVIHLDYETLLGGVTKSAHLDTGEIQSPPPKPAASPARPGSSPPSSAAPPRSSTSAAPAASTPNPRGSPPASNTLTCQAATCDWPSGMSHLHHLDPWSRGGKHRPPKNRRSLPPTPHPDPPHRLRPRDQTQRHHHLPPTGLDRLQHRESVTLSRTQPAAMTGRCITPSTLPNGSTTLAPT